MGESDLVLFLSLSFSMLLLSIGMVSFCDVRSQHNFILVTGYFYSRNVIELNVYDVIAIVLLLTFEQDYAFHFA